MRPTCWAGADPFGETDTVSLRGSVTLPPLTDPCRDVRVSKFVRVDDERLSTGELLMRWRDATRAAELAERLAEIASQAADQADRGALASDQIARMAEKAAVAAERAARSARTAAGQAAELAVENREQRLRDADEAVVTARASETEARGRFQDAERAPNDPQGLPR